MKATYRQLMHFTNAAEELKGRGGFKFRCALAAIVLEASRCIEAFNEARKPAKGIQAFQEEVNLQRENCTITKNDKKEVNVAAFMPLLAKAKATHKLAIEASEKIQAEANKELDNEIEINASVIPMSLLEDADTIERFEAVLLSRLLPFVSGE